MGGLRGWWMLWILLPWLGVGGFSSSSFFFFPDESLSGGCMKLEKEVSRPKVEIET